MSDRVMLNVKVPKEIKEVYDFIIRKNHGFKNPYAGFELEKELRIAFDMGKDSAMYDHLRDLVDEPVEKKNLKDRPFSPGDVMVQYKVHPDIRTELERVKDEGTATMGEFVAKVMYRFVMGDGYQERNRKRAKQAKEEATQEDDDLDTEERRIRGIAEHLEENHDGKFDIEDFNEAVGSVPNISASDHIRGKYLKPVLDRLDAGCDSVGYYLSVRDDRDPRGLPYEAMSKGEKKTAIKAEALQNSKSGGMRGQVDYITMSDAAGVLGTSNRVAKRLMKEIGGLNAGFNYREDIGLSDEPILQVNHSTAKEAEYDNAEALELAGLLEEPELKSDEVQDDPAKADTQKAEVIAD